MDMGTDFAKSFTTMIAMDPCIEIFSPLREINKNALVSTTAIPIQLNPMSGMENYIIGSGLITKNHCQCTCAHSQHL